MFGRTAIIGAIALLSCVLCSARDAMVVWLVQSETVDPSSVDDVIQSVTAAVAARLKADGLIRRARE